MTFAHLAGVPFEEWISPLILSGGGAWIAARAALRRRSLSMAQLLHWPRRIR
jgi:hypothetical protein